MIYHFLVIRSTFTTKKNTNDLGYYGDYGIGLSKKWATRNGFNTVFYLEYNSFVGTTIRKEFENFMKGHKKVFHEIASPRIFLYCKNYEGDLIRDEVRKKKDYRFYDEREWRLVGDMGNLAGEETVLEASLYQSNKKLYNDKIAETRLLFDLSDISYIIVRTEAEVRIIYEALERSSNDSLINLTSIRVLTSEQIISDF